MVDQFLTATITGICTAGIFAIAASGLVLTYTTTGIFNFAHGAVGMLAAFAYWQLIDWGMPTGAAFVFVVLVLAPVFGALVERLIMRGLSEAPDAARLVVSVALLVAALSLGIWLWPPDAGRPLALLFPGEAVTILDVRISYHELLSLILAGVVAVGLRFLLRGTRAGITMRAVVDDRGLAALNGARPDQSGLLAWAIGSSLAALAGILLACLQGLTHIPLTLLIVNAYAAAMFGRLKNLPQTFIGALLLGLLNSYAIRYLPTGNSWGRYLSAFPAAIPVVVLFFVLIALPSARLRTKGANRPLLAPRPSWSTALTVAAAIIGVGILLAIGLSDADAIKTAKPIGLAMIALSLVPLVGWAGQLCLCQMSFAALGALCAVHLGHGGNPWAILAGGLIAALVGAIVALPAARLSGIELALATAAFAVILDRWVFQLPNFDIGPLSLKMFEQRTVPVDRLSFPFVGTLTPSGTLLAMTVALALMHLLVVAVRRSRFGDRLLAYRESPAAAATLGLDPIGVRLGVFAFSAGLAGMGGALYATTLGGVSASTFELFTSLPLLLLTVAGGIGSTGGPLFAGVVLGSIPVVSATFTGLAGILGLLPGTMGITLGRNPDGVVADLRHRLASLQGSAIGLGVAAVGVLVVAALWLTGTLSGWFAFVIGFVAPFLVARVLDVRAGTGPGEAGAREVDPLDRLESGPLDAEAIAALDRALALAEAPA